jgi:hypothetical protein
MTGYRQTLDVGIEESVAERWSLAQPQVEEGDY